MKCDIDWTQHWYRWISLSLASHLHNLINQSINSLIELTYFNSFIIYYMIFSLIDHFFSFIIEIFIYLFIWMILIIKISNQLNEFKLNEFILNVILIEHYIDIALISISFA